MGLLPAGWWNSTALPCPQQTRGPFSPPWLAGCAGSFPNGAAIPVCRCARVYRCRYLQVRTRAQRVRQPRSPRGLRGVQGGSSARLPQTRDDTYYTSWHWWTCSPSRPTAVTLGRAPSCPLKLYLLALSTRRYLYGVVLQGFSRVSARESYGRPHSWLWKNDDHAFTQGTHPPDLRLTRVALLWCFPLCFSEHAQVEMGLGLLEPYRTP